MTVVEQMVKAECIAAAAFESRWTMRALRRVDSALYEAIEEQRLFFNEAIWSGEDDQIAEHGKAMCRGWIAAVQRLESAQEPDDAYFLGQDTTSGTMVAVGASSAAVARVRELHGDRVVWITPDEVAAMFAGMQSVATVKALWPGAEIVRVERYPDEPAQEDA